MSALRLDIFWPGRREAQHCQSRRLHHVGELFELVIDEGLGSL